MRPDTALAFDRMAAAARRDGIYLIVISGYRSDAEQAKLFAAHPAPQLFRVLGRSLARGGSPRRGGRGSCSARRARGRGRTWRGWLRMCGEGERDGDPAEDEPLGLTPRERRCLALVAAGAPNRGIGRQLCMAEKTGVHVSRIWRSSTCARAPRRPGAAHRPGLDAVRRLRAPRSCPPARPPRRCAGRGRRQRGCSRAALLARPTARRRARGRWRRRL
jgi:hypothetical protein